MPHAPQRRHTSGPFSETMSPSGYPGSGLFGMIPPSPQCTVGSDPTGHSKASKPGFFPKCLAQQKQVHTVN